MSIRRWHVGKLIILWAWGGVGAALLLTDFRSGSVSAEPLRYLLELLIALAILAALTIVTWRWLGERTIEVAGKESNCVKED